MEEKNQVKVLFVKSEGEIVAIMPYELGTNNPLTMLCYQHLGQHGSCHASWVQTQKKAQPEEYGQLLSELESLGYEVEITRLFNNIGSYTKRRELLGTPMKEFEG